MDTTQNWVTRVFIMSFYCHRSYGTRARRMTIAAAVLYIFCSCGRNQARIFGSGIYIRETSHILQNGSGLGIDSFQNGNAIDPSSSVRPFTGVPKISTTRARHLRQSACIRFGRWCNHKVLRWDLSQSSRCLPN